MNQYHRFVLDFEKPLQELQEKISELKGVAEKEGIDLNEDIRHLEERLCTLQEHIFATLTPWQRVQLARHPERPRTLELIGLTCDDYLELHGDRLYADDKALVTGLGTIKGKRFVWLGHQRGRSIRDNLSRNFGMAHPEGYRKAHRLMRLAERLGLPIISFVDTPGAYPGIEAEERGQAEAIAANLETMSRLAVPIIVIIVGEGGSGGALGIGVGDRVFMLENAVYSVITPEGCAAIIWKDQEKVEEAAAALKLTAPDLTKLGIIDGIIPEPRGGAHTDPKTTAEAIKDTIISLLSQLQPLSPEQLRTQRRTKYRSIQAR